MYELRKIGKAFSSKFVGTGPSSYKKRIYRAAVSQRLRNTALYDYRFGALYPVASFPKKLCFLCGLTADICSFFFYPY